MQMNNDEHGTEMLDAVIIGIREESVPPLPKSLMHSPLRNVSASTELNTRLLRMPTRSVAVAATVLLCVGVGFLLFQSPQLLAQVQAAIRKAESISFDIETRHGDAVIQRYRIHYSSHEGVRAESATKLHIFNVSDSVILDIDHSSRIAKSRPVYDTEAMQEMLAGSIGELATLDAIEQIEAKRYSVEGKEALELWARWDNAIAHVSVDPQSKLPFRIEVDRGHNRHGEKIVEVVTNIQFGSDIPAGDYSLQVPGGYAFEEIERTELNTAVSGYVLSEDGLGPIKWGMSFNEVVSLIGKPDSFGANPTMVPEMKDGQPVIIPGKGFNLIPAEPPHQIIDMHYDSRGFRIFVSELDGVISVQCYDGRIGRSFPGETNEGIKIGMTREEVQNILKVDRIEDGRFQFEQNRLSVMGASVGMKARE
jgi:hypothetical protein